MTGLRYISFFSGIEMAGLAWQPLGWELVAVAEVDPFACAVLTHYHQGVPNLGDVSRIADDTVRALGPVDVCIFGFPCQDLSLAGKRKGLRNDDGTATRSGLFFDAVRLARASGARWIVGENVPGLFSSNGGRDFGACLAELTGCTFRIPADGWANAGAATGPRGSVCWRTLDAQFAGLAQRRERVFLVVDLGAGADTAPLFPLLESLPGDTPPGVAARQRPAARASGRSRRKGIWEQIASAFRGGAAVGPTQVAGALAASDGRAGADDNDAKAGRLVPELHAFQDRFRGDDGRGYSRPPPVLSDMVGTLETVKPWFVAYGGNDTSGPREIATCLNAKGGASRMDFESETFIACSPPGGGFDGAPMAFSCKDDGRDVTINLAPTMRSMTFDKSHANAGGQIAIAFHARQDPDTSGDVTHPLDTDGHSIGIAFGTTQITSAENRCNPQPGDPCHPLSATAHPPAYATRYEIRRLLPVECERLMGVPDGYTNIPYRGRNDAPDGPRYKALGNGFAVPEIRWIGQQIDKANRMRCTLPRLKSPEDEA